MARNRRKGWSVEWPTMALIAGCYAGWAASLFLLWPLHPVAALLLCAVMLALQSSLMHEAIHGHPTREAWVNELLVGLPVGLVYPFRRFKAHHLSHHADERLTDPFDDPESYYQSQWKHAAMPPWLRALLRVNNTMAGRLVLGPWLGTVGFLNGEARLLKAGDPAVRRAWLHHVAGLALVLPLIAASGMPLWLYALVPVWLGQSLIAVRTFAEHRWSERPDGRTLIVERSPFAWLFLNNNLHLVHHKNPNVPWYRLPKLFRARRDEWIGMNGGYVYPSYWALFRAFAFKVKEPVAHPFLRRTPEAGRAFAPRARGRNVNGLGTVPVPSQPLKD